MVQTPEVFNTSVLWPRTRKRLDALDSNTYYYEINGIVRIVREYVFSYVLYKAARCGRNKSSPKYKSTLRSFVW